MTVQIRNTTSETISMDYYIKICDGAWSEAGSQPCPHIITSKRADRQVWKPSETKTVVRSLPAAILRRIPDSEVRLSVRLTDLPNWTSLKILPNNAPAVANTPAAPVGAVPAADSSNPSIAIERGAGGRTLIHVTFRNAAPTQVICSGKVAMTMVATAEGATMTEYYFLENTVVEPESDKVVTIESADEESPGFTFLGVDLSKTTARCQ